MDYTRIARASGRLVFLVAIVLAWAAWFQPEARAETYVVFMARMLASESGNVRFRADLEADVARLVNRYRVSKGGKPLRLSNGLRGAARAHAMDLALRNAMGHSSATGHGFDSRMRALKGGSLFLPQMGENAARVRSGGGIGAKKVRMLVQSWIDSPGHRKAMVNRSFIEVSTGVVQKGNELYAVQIFSGPDVKTSIRRANQTGVY